MNENDLLKIIEESVSIVELSNKLYGKSNETTRRKLHLLFNKLNYNWGEHIKNISLLKKKYCLNCGNELKKGQYKFCSKSCAASFNNKKRGTLTEDVKNKISLGLQKYHNEEKKYIKNKLKKSICIKNNNIIDIDYDNKNYEHFCKFCGKPLNHKRTKFCDINCRNSYKENEYKKYIENWKNGNECGHTPSLKLDEKVRRYLFEKNNNKCQKCGWGEINPHTNKVPLQIHHIDGDCTNNSEENLELLCPNCHSLTENFGSTNRNSKRIFRKQKLYGEEKI